MIRIIGFLFIILSSSGIGYIMGTRFDLRVRELKLLKVALQMLETEIVYSNTPLPLAFESVQRKSTHPISNLFKAVKYNLEKRTFGSVGEAFCQSIDDTRDQMSLSKEDIETLKSFGNSIGNSDIEGQVKSFKMIIKQLDSQEIKAEESKDKNEKMYKSLGFLGGLAIVILLL